MNRVARLLIILVLGVAGIPAQAMAQPRPDFATDAITIETQRGGSLDFTVELALTPGEQAYGLMFVEEMPMDHGMLFVFPEPRPASFWMRNTLIPLDMLFIEADGTILNIEAQAEPQTETPRRSAGPVRGVLEINGGLAALLGIRPGDGVLHEAFETAP